MARRNDDDYRDFRRQDMVAVAESHNACGDAYAIQAAVCAVLLHADNPLPEY